MMNRITAELIHTAAEDPGRVALVQEERTITWRTLVNSALEMADFLKQARANSIGLYFENSIEWVIADLACLIAGITCVPLPRFFTDAQLRHIIDRAGVAVIFHDDRERLSGLGLKFSSCRTILGIAAMFIAGRHHGGDPQAPSCIAKITFTSGTTDRPRGVCLSQDNIERTALCLTDRLQDLRLDSHLCVLPLSTLLENIAGLYVPLLMQKKVHLLSSAGLGFNGSSGFDVGQFIRQLDRLHPDSLILLPQLLAALVQAGDAGLKPETPPAWIAVGGARTAPELIRRARRQGLPVYEGYGLSETASVVSLNVPGEDRVGSVGRPLQHVRVRIDNGEILVGGNSFSGYIEQPSDPTGWLRSGDLGHIDDDGYLHVSGRRKNLIITGYGRNISPEWIESEVTASPCFRQCLVFGDGRPFCGAILVPAPGCGGEQAAACIREINARLPDYARIKTWLIEPEGFTAENGLLTANGRPRRARILDRFRDQIASLYEDNHVNEVPDGILQ